MRVGLVFNSAWLLLLTLDVEGRRPRGRVVTNSCLGEGCAAAGSPRDASRTDSANPGGIIAVTYLKRRVPGGTLTLGECGCAQSAEQATTVLVLGRLHTALHRLAHRRRYRCVWVRRQAYVCFETRRNTRRRASPRSSATGPGLAHRNVRPRPT